MTMEREPSTILKLCLLFLFVVWVVASVKLIRIWRPALPFRLNRQANSPAYLRILQTSSSSIQVWTRCTPLVWAIFMSATFYDSCINLSNQRVIGTRTVLYLIPDQAMALELALTTALFLFLIRWHVLETNRMPG
jgi:hypothetical protein